MDKLAVWMVLVGTLLCGSSLAVAVFMVNFWLGMAITGAAILLAGVSWIYTS